jgi:hypothetical protein
MNFLQYKIIGAPKKFKHQPRPLVRSSSLKFNQNFFNLSHETVPLSYINPPATLAVMVFVHNKLMIHKVERVGWSR